MAEHLTEFLLSKIAFLSQPVSIGDDLGTDYFCTLFEARGDGKNAQQYPLNSFAIQIKSGEPRAIAMDNKIEYLKNLEIPFFIGFVDQAKLELNIYSGEHLPVFFGMGTPSSLCLLPLQNVPVTDVHNDLSTAGEHPGTPLSIKCPFAIKIGAQDTVDELSAKSQKLKLLCERALQNNASQIVETHFYQLDDKLFEVLAGSGSVQVFRKNLCRRLNEAFANLKWLLKASKLQPENYAFDLKEFEIYQSFFLEMKAHGIKEAEEVQSAYNATETALRECQPSNGNPER